MPVTQSNVVREDLKNAQNLNRWCQIQILFRIAQGVADHFNFSRQTFRKIALLAEMTNLLVAKRKDPNSNTAVSLRVLLSSHCHCQQGHSLLLTNPCNMVVLCNDSHRLAMGHRVFGFCGTVCDATFHFCHGIHRILPFVVGKLWCKLVAHCVLTCHLHRHSMTFSWTLNCLKMCPSWNVDTAAAGVSVANCRKRVIKMIEHLSKWSFASCSMFAVPLLHIAFGPISQLFRFIETIVSQLSQP